MSDDTQHEPAWLDPNYAVACCSQCSALVFKVSNASITSQKRNVAIKGKKFCVKSDVLPFAMLCSLFSNQSADQKIFSSFRKI